MKLNIHGKQYDVTGFAHPGGNEILELCKGEPDCTALFESYHAFCNKQKIASMMKKYEVKDSECTQMFSFPHDGFYITLRDRIITHFENKIGRKLTRSDVKANLDWFNTVFWIWCLFLFSQYQMLFASHWLVRSVCGLTSGIAVTGFAFNVLHDASHYGVSSSPKVNQLLSSFHQGLQMWNQILWAYHHVIRHHQYTGNVDFDPDMRHTMPYIRKTNKIQSRHETFTRNNFVFKFMFVNIIFPGNMLGQGLEYHLNWIRKGRLWKMSLPKTFQLSGQAGQYIISTIFFANMFWFGEMYTWFHIIGMNLAYFIGSAPNHDLFPTHTEINKFDNMSKMDWGETQVRGSANFCNSSIIFTKFMGGINTQIEHHLFPSMCNHYLIEIAPIVKRTCEEFKIPYNHIDDPKEVFTSLMNTYYDVYDKDEDNKKTKSE
jgi:fatty acid desaturase